MAGSADGVVEREIEQRIKDRIAGHERECDVCEEVRGQFDGCEDAAILREVLALLSTRGAALAEMQRERDVLVETRNSDYAILLDAFRERGEAVPGSPKESTVLRVVRGIHGFRERAESLESQLTEARAEIERLREELDANRACNLYTWKEQFRKAESELSRLQAEGEALRDALRQKIAEYRAMATASFADGPIPGDEREHAGRWTMAEIIADELEALLTASAPSSPQEKK